MEIEAKIDIDRTSLESVIEDVLERILDDKITEYLDGNISEYIESYMRDNFDIEEYLDGVDLGDYIELPDVTSSVEELLEDYTPGNTCDTGKKFTSAVGRAIGYFKFDITNPENKDFMKSCIEEIFNQNLSQNLRVEIEKQIANGITKDLKRDVIRNITSSFNNVLYQQ